MGFKIAGIMLVNWLTGKPNKKIYGLHKAITKLKKMVANAEREKKFYMEEAARELEGSDDFGGKYKSSHLERRDVYEHIANESANLQLRIHEQVVSLEILLEREMQDGFTTKTPFGLCLL